jgi:hypothetical protein
VDFTAECWRSATEFNLSSIGAAMLGAIRRWHHEEREAGDHLCST